MPQWLTSLSADLNQIAALRENWDRYGALPVTGEAIKRSLLVLPIGINEQLPRPQVGATVRGGVEFEWHTGDVDLQIQTELSGIHVYYNNEGLPDGEKEREFEDLSVAGLTKVLEEIMPSARGTSRLDKTENGPPQER